MGLNIVTHIELNMPGDRRSGIRKIHGQTDGRPWVFTEAQAIRMILGLDGTAYEFFVYGATRTRARVTVAGAPRHQFLKTEADGVSNNNLLALPEWPYAA